MAQKQIHIPYSSSAYLIFSVTFISVHFLISSATAQQDPLYHFCEYDKGNFTSGSHYSSNLNSLISSLETLEANDYGFYNFSVRGNGTEGDRSNAIALCRGDVRQEACVGCIRTAGNEVRDRCQEQKEAMIWYDDCMFRYSNRSMLGVMEPGPSFSMRNRVNVTDKERFERALGDLLETLRDRAAAGGARRKYATGNATATAFVTAYALVQCTPDLTGQDCNDCLIRSFARIPRCCDRKEGGRVVTPSCNTRFEIYQFFDPAGDPQPPAAALPPDSTPTANGKGKGNNTSRAVIAVVVPIVAIFIIIVFLFIFKKSRKKRMPKQEVEEDEGVDEIRSAEFFQLQLETIRTATNNFSSENKLGQGGFGTVYKGRLYDGQEIAVKRLSRNSGQGDLEFKNEVLLLAKLQHRNLVRLLGFCIEGKERLLVYEFVPNASLDQFIFDSIKRENLDWERRYKIIGGVARGLLYLHEDSRLRIIHRDLKASNILLDEHMNPKIADFGMARLFDMDETQGATTRVVGTYGYMAPEYALYGQFSVKTDVFSFGVLVLEILSGQKNKCFQHEENREDLVSFAWRNWREGTGQNLVDRSLTFGSSNEIMRCINIGLLCVQDNVANRPTMASVVLMLNSFSVTLPAPSQPAFLAQSSSFEPELSTSWDYNSKGTESSGSKSEALPLSKNEASITELSPR